MKKTLLIVAVAGLAFASCKKDKTCECTQTTTFSSGSTSITTTDPVETTEIKDIKGGEAKTMCQKSTQVSVNGNNTSTTVNDCKLK